jgi:hypothetical protein
MLRVWKTLWCSCFILFYETRETNSIWHLVGVAICVTAVISYQTGRLDNLEVLQKTHLRMMFRIVFWDVLPCKIIIHFTLQYIGAGLAQAV